MSDRKKIINGFVAFVMLTKQYSGDKNKRAEKSIGDEECRNGIVLGAVYVLAAATGVCGWR